MRKYIRRVVCSSPGRHCKELEQLEPGKVSQYAVCVHAVPHKESAFCLSGCTDEGRLKEEAFCIPCYLMLGVLRLPEGGT